MVWWPFAPKLERADTLEVTDLHSGAPPLYSTIFVVNEIKVIVPGYLHGSLKSLLFSIPPELCENPAFFQLD